MAPHTWNVLTPVAVRIGAIGWLPRYLAQITAVDRFLQRLTRGRWSLLRIAGLPGLTLTVAGRRSGIPRSTPLLCVPFGADHLVAGSNFGGARPPVWVGNVRAADEVTVTIGGTPHLARPREVTGEERDRLWAQMNETWPNYAKYEERTDRVIPVFLLERL